MTERSLSPGRLAWQRLRKNRTALIGGITLIVLYFSTSFGSLISPYDPADAVKGTAHHPPTLPRFVDEHREFHFRPFIYGMKMSDPERHLYRFDLSQKYPIRFFVRGTPYRLWWLFPTNLHLFGV